MRYVAKPMALGSMKYGHDDFLEPVLAGGAIAQAQHAAARPGVGHRRDDTGELRVQGPPLDRLRGAGDDVADRHRHDARKLLDGARGVGVAVLAVPQEQPCGDEERAGLLQRQLQRWQPVFPEQEVTAVLVHQRLVHLRLDHVEIALDGADADAGGRGQFLRRVAAGAVPEHLHEPLQACRTAKGCGHADILPPAAARPKDNG